MSTHISVFHLFIFCFTQPTLSPSFLSLEIRRPEMPKVSQLPDFEALNCKRIGRAANLGCQLFLRINVSALVHKIRRLKFHGYKILKYYLSLRDGNIKSFVRWISEEY